MSGQRVSILAVSAMPVLPVSNGYSLRVSNLVRELAREWRLILIAAPGSASSPPPESLGISRFVPMPLFRGWTSVLSDVELGELRDSVDAIVREENVRAAVVWAGAEEVLRDNPRFPPTILDRLDSEIVIGAREVLHADSLKNRLRAVRHTLAWVGRERRLVRQVAHTIVDSPLDARMLRLVSQRSSVHIVPNGVRINRAASPSEESATPTVCFTGSLSYVANVQAVHWFVKRVWPAVLAAVPNARFIIAGRDPSSDVLGLAGARGIELRANVDDISAVIREAWLAVAPVWTGSGIRTKVLEAWAVGRPVVMSSVAASGLRMGGDRELASLVQDTPRAVARITIELLRDASRRHRLGRAAFELAAREYHEWSRGAGVFSGLLRQLTDGQTGS